MSRRTTLALAACLLAAACTDDPTPVAGGGAIRSTASADPRLTDLEAETPELPFPESAAPTSAAFPANTAPDDEEPSGGPLGVVAVRVANGGDYDRVVFELRGRSAGAPGWRVEYVDNPSQDGSGEPVEVDGDATLAVRIKGVGYPQDTGVEEAVQVGGPGATEVVADVELGAVFEGVYEAWIGTSRKAPFRVFRLADPARVVVDVRHD